MAERIVVFGASGRTGGCLVQQALETGLHVRAVARDVSRMRLAPHECMEPWTADVMQLQDVEDAVEGADAVLSVIGRRPGSPPNLMQGAADCLIEAMKRRKVLRLVMMLGAGAPMPLDPPPPASRQILQAFAEPFAHAVMADFEQALQRLRQSDLAWTAVRPPRLTNGPRTGVYRTGYLRLGALASISRADVADFMLAAVRQRSFMHEAPMVSY